MDVFFQPFSKAETEFFDNSATREGGAGLGELLAEDVVEPTGGVRARTGFRADVDGEEVDEVEGFAGSVFESEEVGDVTGFRRGEPGASFRMKRPAVVVPGLVGGEEA